MTREEAIKRLLKFIEDNNLSGLVDTVLSNPWHKASEELPPINTEVVCKMKGVPRTEHFICKWDGKFWLHWKYIDQYNRGWFVKKAGKLLNGDYFKITFSN